MKNISLLGLLIT